MKKIKWIILGLGIFVSFNVGNSNVVNAADNETATETTESNAVPSDVKNAVDNLLDNYTNDNITVTDASFHVQHLMQQMERIRLMSFPKFL